MYSYLPEGGVVVRCESALCQLAERLAAASALREAQDSGPPLQPLVEFAIELVTHLTLHTPIIPYTFQIIPVHRWIRVAVYGGRSMLYINHVQH